jgi:tetratricopeptide (TPR) repeat protein
VTPSASADMELMRASVLLDTDPAEAARRANAILANSPGHAAANLLIAAACRRLGDPATASQVLEGLTSTVPDSPVLQIELGRAYQAGGRDADALAAFKRAVALDPGLAEGWREVAALLFGAGDIAGGDSAYAQYSRLTPDPPELADATTALHANRLALAEDLLQRRLQQAPRDVVAMRLYAGVAIRAEDFDEAERRIARCLELAPGYAAARFDLARVLHAAHRHAEVIPHLDRLVALEPGNVAYLRLRAQTTRFLGRTDEAVAMVERMLADDPGDAESWLILGHLVRELGQQARAIDAYRRALALQPDLGEAYSSVANLKTFRFSTEDIAAMQRQLARTALLAANRTQLEFALGKALEDEGQYQASFEHYVRGNALYRATISNDPDAISTAARHFKAAYTAQFFRDRAGWGDERRDPIFVIGMPRSGSTLLEQILASHSQVEGANELRELGDVVFEVVSRHGAAAEASDYANAVAAIRRDEIEACADAYLARTRVHRPLGKPRFIDKMPANFWYVGLIHLMFPQAAIIDARRHPLGCGFSCYKQLFARDITYSYDLREMGRHYRDYAELMAHFDAVLPGRVYRAHYEHLVADPEREIRRLLDYCGLPFEAQCLRFHETRRIVRTISSEQVRVPIYAEGVDQWRHYEPWLGPLKAALGTLVEEYPPSPVAT